MNNILKFNFNSGGFLGCELSDEEFLPLLEEVSAVSNNFENAEPYNSHLVGNLKHEYVLTKNVKLLEDIAVNLAKTYCENFDYIVSGGNKLALHEYWVNFQRKHEFNPLHSHDGEFVFVIFVKIPFTIEEEKAATSYVKEDINRASNFVFQYINALGEISKYELPVDRNFERRMILFPARLNHQVYPFYSSDEYRITISGNLFLKTES